MASSTKAPEAKASAKKRKKAESGSESSDSDGGSTETASESGSGTGSDSGSDVSDTGPQSSSESDYVPDAAESESSTSADEHDSDKSNSEKEVSDDDGDGESAEQPPVKKLKTDEAKTKAAEPIISLLSDDEPDAPVAAAAAPDDLFEQLLAFGAPEISAPKPVPKSDAKTDFEALLQWGEPDAKKKPDETKKAASKAIPPTSQTTDAKKSTSDKKRSPTGKCDKCGKRRVVTHCGCDKVYCKDCQVRCPGCKELMCSSHWQRCRARKSDKGAPSSACGVATCTNDNCVLTWFRNCTTCDSLQCKTCHFTECVYCGDDECRTTGVKCQCGEK